MRSARHLSVKGESQAFAALRLQDGAFLRDDQIARDLRTRIGEDLADLSFLGNVAVVDDRHPVTDLVDDLHFMGDHHDRHTHFIIDLPKQLQNRPCRVRVQCRGGLVAEDVLGIRGEGPCDGHALLLAARKLGGIGVFPVAQPDQLQKLSRPFLRLLSSDTGDLQWEADVPKHRALFQQVEALKDHSDGLSKLQKLRSAQHGQALSVHQDFSGGGHLQKVDTSHQRALACARKPDDSENLSVPDRQVDVVQRHDLLVCRAVGLAEML